MKLIQHFENSEYPTEYLLARIRGRHVQLFRDWEELLLIPDPFNYLLSLRCGGLLSVYSNEGVWKCLLKEYKWVHLQMNSMLREVFQPFFIFHEIKTLISCIRLKKAKETEAEIEEILRFSLLSGEIREILTGKTDILNVTAELIEIFSNEPFRFRGLEEAFSKNGLKGFEQKLYPLFLEHIISSGLHALIRTFFSCLIDIKNIIAVYKYLKWEISGPPEFISGGDISASKLRKISRARDVRELAPFIGNFTGTKPQKIITSGIEAVLLTGLTKKIRIIQKEDLSAGLILDYLWKVFIETHNFSVILYGAEIEKDVLREELITL